MPTSTLGTEPYEWAGLSAAKIRNIGANDGSLVVIPVGSVEQHGPHLPVATDTILVKEMVNAGVGQVAADLPVVVTPPIWSGFSPHHLSFGGTLSLDFENLRAVLEDIAHSAIENGFDAVLFVNGHGGNISLINAVVSTVGTETSAEVLGLSYFELAVDEVEALRSSSIGGMAHGGEFETSLMLSLRPDLVAHPEDFDAELWDEHYEWGGKDLLRGGSLSVYRPFKDYSESGAIGAPEHATAEKGERIRTIIGEELAAILVAIHEHNT